MRRCDLLAVLVTVAAVFGLLWSWPADAAPTGTTCTGALCQVDATGDLRTNGGAATESLEVEVCVTNVTFNRVLASNERLAGAKSLYVENRSSATCYGTLDAVSLTTAGAAGYKWAAGTERAFDVDGSVFGSLLGFNCTATQTTGACLFLGWLK